MVFSTLGHSQDKIEGNNGIISAVDIQAKTIQIGEKTYGLVDGIIVHSKNNNVLSQLALAPDQQIQFALAPQPLDSEKNSPLPAQVVTNIRILSGYNENSLKK